jgi:catechol-2,3-dioxygenase
MPDLPDPLPAMRLGEIVLGTARYEAMRDWYGRVLALEPASEHAPGMAGPDAPTRICFFRLHADHPYQDVVAIFEMQGVVEDGRRHAGLHHMQLRNASIPVLQERYRRLRASGTVPYLAMDHGPTTSLYYRDPDGNVVEIAASNFATLEQAQAALASESFLRNPGGEVIDAQAWSATGPA